MISTKKKLLIVGLIVAICAIGIQVVTSIKILDFYYANQDKPSGENPIIVIKSESSRSDVNISDEELVSYINENFFICPECGSPMWCRTSSGQGAASAQMRCYNCEYCSAEVYKEFDYYLNPEKGQELEDECKEECIKNFKEIYGDSFDRLAINIANSE